LPAASGPRAIPLSAILLIAFAVHFPLMLMQLPINSYDANYHIFFSAHYAQHWFSPWNTKWYAGFSQTMYPPLPQQWTALFSHVLGLNLAYLFVQFIFILLLPVGVYRYAKLWVDERAASYAALGSVFIGSLSFLVYQAGQLSTTAAAPLYLNAVPYLYFWIRRGSLRSLLKGLALGAAAAAAHHVTLIFGSVLFALPVIWLAVMDAEEDADEGNARRSVITRAIIFALLAMVVVGIVLYPFFAAVLHNPVKQAPIPHQSRLNYLLNPEWGLNYFVIPYGALILALPWIFYYGATRRRLRPLFVGFWVTLILSLGGTTPLPKLFLGRVFDILTYERFTLWGCVMALPIVGLVAEKLIDRYRRKAMAALWIAAASTCGLAVAWTSFHPISFETSFNVQPVIDFLNREDHSQFRYITLGFGQQMSRVNTYAKAETVDGDYNSARLLPELTSYGGAQLNSAKYFGSAGMDSLLSILKHADQYGLRYVFVRDRWYEPLLSFAGWRPTEEYDNGLITLWSKDDTPPAKPVVIDPKAIPTHMQGVLWGVLPIGSSIVAMILIILLPEFEYSFARTRAASEGVSARKGFGVVFAVLTVGALLVGLKTQSGATSRSNSPDGVARQLLSDVQRNDFDAAYGLVSNKAAVSRQRVASDLTGEQSDLLNYATLENYSTEVIHQSDTEATVRAALTWSTAVGPFHDTRDLKLVQDQGNWRINWPQTEEKRVPPQVIPLTFLQWEVIRRGPQDDWGTQDVDSPRVRIIAMNATEYNGSAVVLGEIENEDTVPAFVSVDSTLLDNSGKLLAQESSFDKINHVLLPKAVSPFRIDFPGIALKQIKDIRMRTGSALISAAADPTVGVVNQKIVTNSTGQHVLSAELVNQGGKVINVAHLILTAYDSNGKLTWVTDSYVPHALLPGIPVPVSVELRNDLPANVDNYRVITNYFLTRHLDQ
jgi:hypothetical protein